MKLNGGKITKSHTTLIESAKPLIDFASKNALVSKISLGRITVIKGKGSSEKRIKRTEEKACLMVKIRGGRAIQEFRFFSTEVSELSKQLKTEAEKEGFSIS